MTRGLEHTPDVLNVNTVYGFANLDTKHHNHNKCSFKESREFVF